MNDYDSDYDYKSTASSGKSENEILEGEFKTLSELIFKKVLNDFHGMCHINEIYTIFEQKLKREEIKNNLIKVPYIRLIKKGNQDYVVVFRKCLILCSNYVGRNPCSNGNCRHLHLCKNVVAGTCRYGKNCKLNHDVLAPQNQRIFDKHGLSSLSLEKMKLAIRYSLPEICKDYINDSCKENDCPYVHICDQMVNYGDKHEKDDCNLNHDYNDLSITKIFSSFKLNKRGSHRRRFILSPTNFPYTTEKDKTNSGKGGKKNKPKTKPKVISQDRRDRFLEWLVKEKKGKCLYQGLKEFPYVSQNIQDIRKLLKECHDRIMFFPNDFPLDSGDVEVRIFYPELKFCSDYFTSNCSNNKCLKIHVCEGWLNDACKREKCPKNHNFNHPNTMKLKNMLGLAQSYADKHIKLIIQSSFPILCVPYNVGKCVENETCPFLHICSEFLLHRRHNKCSRDHTNSSSATKKILKFYRLPELDSLKSLGAILIPKSLWREGKKSPSKKETSNNQADSVCKNSAKKISNEMLSIFSDKTVSDKLNASKMRKPRSRSTGPPTKTNFSIPKNGALEELALAQQQNTCIENSRDIIIEKKVVHWLIMDHGGKTSQSNVLQTLFLSEIVEPKEWLKQRKNLLVFPGVQDSTVQVSFSGCRLCVNYLNPTKLCKLTDCVFLHLCRDFVMDYCQRDNCKMSHNVADSHNSKILNNLELSSYDASKIKMVIRNSMPQLCLSYVMGRCYGESCPFVHVCPTKFNILKKDKECRIHSQNLNTFHNRKIFEFFKISEESCNDSMRRRLILFPSIVTRNPSCVENT